MTSKARGLLAVMTTLFALSACAGGSTAVERPRTSTPTPGFGFRAPQVMQSSQVDGIIGQSASALTRRFGEARIDLAEGDARKLQFVSENCVLDIYLYPLSSNTSPVATHIEARERENGREMDHAQCVAAIERFVRTQ